MEHCMNSDTFDTTSQHEGLNDSEETGQSANDDAAVDVSQSSKDDNSESSQPAPENTTGDIAQSEGQNDEVVIESTALRCKTVLEEYEDRRKTVFWKAINCRQCERSKHYDGKKHVHRQRFDAPRIIRKALDRIDELYSSIQAGYGNCPKCKIEEALREMDSCVETISMLCVSGVYEGNLLLDYVMWRVEEVCNRMTDDEDLRARFFVNPDADFTRDRKFTLSRLITLLLSMAGDDLNSEIYNYFRSKGVKIPTASGYVQQRDKLKPEGMEYFFCEIRKECNYLLKTIGLLPCKSEDPDDVANGREIAAIDGSDINTAQNPESDSFVNPKGKKGYNQFHLNTIYSISCGMFIAGFIQPKTKTHETMAAALMLQSLSIENPVLVTADRGYGSLNLFETIRRLHNCDYLIRIKESFIKETKQLPMEELDTDIKLHIITTQKKGDKERVKNGEAKYLPGQSKFGKYKKDVSWSFESEVDMTFRVVRFKLDSGAWETLATSLSRDEFDIVQLKEIYHLRWGLESAYRYLKYDCHLAQMHCKKETASKLEIFARLSMYNIVSTVIAVGSWYEKESLKGSSSVAPEKKSNDISQDSKSGKAKKQGKCSGKNSSKQSSKPRQQPEYKINRHFATHLVMCYFQNPECSAPELLDLMLRHKSPIRTGRSFVRNMKGAHFASFLYR